VSSSKINILFTGLSSNDAVLNPLMNHDKINFINFPTIEIRKRQLTIDDLNKIENANRYDYLIFTSANGVSYFMKYYKNEFSTLNCNTSIIAIGKKTASLLLSNNIDVDIIPSNSSSKSIDMLLTSNLVKGKSILIPGSKLSKVDLLNSLEDKGAMVDFVAIYENGIPQNISAKSIEKVKMDDLNLLVFTSPSTFHNFLSIFKIDNTQQYFANKNIATIGSVTKEAIENEKLSVDIIPQEFNLNSLINEIMNYYKIN
jgi:uroporphyrinogen-III synthase